MILLYSTGKPTAV